LDDLVACMNEALLLPVAPALLWLVILVDWRLFPKSMLPTAVEWAAESLCVCVNIFIRKVSFALAFCKTVVDPVFYVPRCSTGL